MTAIGVDAAPTLLATGRGRLTFGVCADARALPFGDRSIDVVMCSQLLHHFEFSDARLVLSELNRVARHAVIVSDLRRSWIAAVGFWLAALPLRFHPITRHDGVLSVLRGFTAIELSGLVASSTGTSAAVRRRFAYRVTARWQPMAQPRT